MNHLEPLLQQAERRAIVTVLRSHPDWTLEYLSGVLDEGRAGTRTALLRELTLGELIGETFVDLALGRLAPDGGPCIDRARLELAKRVSGEAFDVHVHEVIAEAGGRSVGASYLRARVGGPRWKLQASLARLVATGVVTQRGRTSATRYRVAELVAAE